MKTYITNIDGAWYAFAAERDNVYSIGADSDGAVKSGGYSWTGRRTAAGVKYVASVSPSRNAAYQKARRYGDYNGEAFFYQGEN